MKHTLIGALLGCVLMLVIGAASVDTTGRFGNMNLSGYLTLSGETNRLTDANGVLTFNSDGATELLSLQLSDTDKFSVRSNGGITSGSADDEANTIHRFRSDIDNGGQNAGVRDYVVRDSASNNYYVQETHTLSASNPGAVSGTWYGETYSTNGTSTTALISWAGGTADFGINFSKDGGDQLQLLPASPGVPYRFGTTEPHGSGDLVRIRNATTNKFAVAWSGSVTASRVATEPTAPAAGYYTLFAIDNGGGKMVLKVRFPTGASQTIATEP